MASNTALSLSQTLTPVLPKHSERLQLWEICPEFICPVVGLCTTLQEQKAILRRAGYKSAGRQPNELHAFLVKQARTMNPVSQRLDKCLNQKFRKELVQFGTLDQPQFMEAWRKSLTQGEILGLLWTAVTRGDLNQSDIDQIYNDIHMLSFQNIKDGLKEKRTLVCLELKNLELETQLKGAVSQRRILAKEKKALEKDLIKLERQHQVLEKRCHRLAELADRQMSQRESVGHVECQSKRSELEGLRRQVKEYSHQAQIWQGRYQLVMEKLNRQQEINGRLRQEISRLSQPCCDLCPKLCPNSNLGARRILLVGGITKLEPFYREQVETLGGQFEYHDGYMQQGKKNLEDRIKYSDVVLCPLSCNSHTARRCVRKLCRKYNKPFYTLPGSSLESVSQALVKIADHQNNSNNR